MATTKVHRVGDATVLKIPELALDASDPAFFYPGQVNVRAAVEETRKLWPGSVDPQTGLLRLSIHAWLVRTPTRIILVDTGAGNGKDRPNLSNLDHLNGPFLERLKAAGVSPDEVDLVLLTHLHVDHVGWNTRKVDGRWVPTFPNARYVFSGRERAYLTALSASDGSDAAIRAEAKLGTMPHPPMLGIYEGVYEDSIRPVMDAGLAREIVNRIQKSRKDLNFNVADRIMVLYSGDPELEKAISRHQDYICGETLAKSLEKSQKLGPLNYDIDDYKISLEITRT